MLPVAGSRFATSSGSCANPLAPPWATTRPGHFQGGSRELLGAAGKVVQMLTDPQQVRVRLGVRTPSARRAAMRRLNRS